MLGFFDNEYVAFHWPRNSRNAGVSLEFLPTSIGTRLSRIAVSGPRKKGKESIARMVEKYSTKEGEPAAAASTAIKEEEPNQ
jgi:hypothetical protein